MSQQNINLIQSAHKNKLKEFDNFLGSISSKPLKQQIPQNDFKQ